MTTENAFPMSSQPEAARKALDRNDLLMLARDAEEAVGIVFGREDALAHDFEDEAALFSAALRLQQATADNTDSDDIRLRALTDAGIIVRFCDLVGIELAAGDRGSGWLHAEVLRGLADAREIRGGEELDGDLHLGLTVRRKAVRDIRLDEHYETAIELASLSDKEFVGTGADQLRAEYQVEIGAALLMAGQASDVRPALIESEESYWATAAGQFPSRHRFDYVLALGAWADGDLPEAAQRLSRAQQHLHSTSHGEQRWDVEDLLLALAQADLLAAGGDRSAATIDTAAEHIDEALSTVERIRDRWKVISRSRSPLSVAFRRIYGDIALAAASFSGRSCAELGLRAALSAKQTGFALRMRTGRAALAKGSQVRRLIDLVVKTETGTAASPFAAGATADALDSARRGLQKAATPMLADTVLPIPPSVAQVTGLVGDRYALDYVSLPDTSTAWTKRANWFRALIEPGGAVSFERLTIGTHLAAFIGHAEQQDAELGPILGNADWQALAANLLPGRLRDRLLAAATTAPVELIISPHSALSVMPWPALKLDRRTRLIDGAVIAQTPVLTCLSGEPAPSVVGPAIVDLASTGPATATNPAAELPAIDIKRERLAWVLSRGEEGQVPLYECAVGPDPSPRPIPGTLAAALSSHEGYWHFLHIASHGEGSGLDQTLHLRDEPISAGRALSLRWPESVLMASCHIGRLVNVADGEPLNLVMALLAGGSRCVVAGIDTVPSDPTSSIAAEIVRLCQKGGIGLDAALRLAQQQKKLHAERAWALLGTYLR
jgi:hypothetical protein